MCLHGEIHYFFSLDTVPVEEEGKDGENVIIPLSKGNQFNITYDSEYMEEVNNIRSRLSFERKKAKEKREKEIEEMEERGEEVDLKLLNTEEEKKDDDNIMYEEPNNNLITVKVKAISKKIVKVNLNVVDEDYHKNIRFTEPRPLRIINKFVKPRTPWTYPISIWSYYEYEYEGEPEEYLDQCFDFDFKR